MRKNSETIDPQLLLDTEEALDSDKSTLDGQTDWYIGIDMGRNKMAYYGREEFVTELQNGILDGKYQKNTRITKPWSYLLR